MIPHVSSGLPSTALGIALGLIGLCSCGEDDGIGTRYPVHGTVTYRKKPVSSGMINFLSGDPNKRSATGQISGGAYRLTTHSPDDGALPGTYNVTISAVDVDLGPALKDGFIMQDEIARAPKKHLVPRKYSGPETSGLTREVRAETNRFDFELTD